MSPAIGPRRRSRIPTGASTIKGSAERPMRQDPNPMTGIPTSSMSVVTTFLLFEQLLHHPSPSRGMRHLGQGSPRAKGSFGFVGVGGRLKGVSCDHKDSTNSMALQSFSAPPLPKAECWRWRFHTGEPTQEESASLRHPKIQTRIPLKLQKATHRE